MLHGYWVIFFVKTFLWIRWIPTSTIVLFQASIFGCELAVKLLVSGRVFQLVKPLNSKNSIILTMDS